MRVLLSLTLLVLLVLSISAQRPEDMTRKLWDTAFTSSSTKKSTNRRRAYRNATPNVPVNNVAPETVVGMTLWRLRPPRRTDSGERLIVHDDNTEWVPERISATTRLGQGDRIRISVEAVRAGFVYIIDREQYADGSLGEPYLIFPTTRTGGGDNEVAIGRLLDIPAQDDSPPFFVMKKSRTDHVAEVLSVIVTPMTDSLSAQQREKLQAAIPLGRLGQPEDVAAAVVYLASDQAGWVTGATMHVNGGMAML